MPLLPIDTPEMIETVAGWLSEKRNYKWLDFGNGVQKLNPVSLKLMLQNDIHLLRAYENEDGTPIGVVGLSNIDHQFKTATLWGVLGDRSQSNKGHPLRASSEMLTSGFDGLGLRVVNAWAVETNYASLRIMRRLNFRRVGIQRKCHFIDGEAYDRVLFDLMDVEHREAKNE